MKKLLAKLAPYAKAVVAGAVGAVVPLLTVGQASGYDWKAIASAAGGGALSALLTFLTPNKAGRTKAGRA